MAVPFPSGHKTLSTDLNPMLLGWIDFSWVGSTLAYVSADSPTFVFSIDADVTGILEPGMRIRLTQDKTVTPTGYFIVTAVGAYSGGVTQVTVYGGTDYSLENVAITAGAFSTAKKPFGFPVDPLKWTEELADTTARSISSPTNDTWFNIASLSLDVPIGAWHLSFDGMFEARRTSGIGGEPTVKAALSTADNSATDAKLIAAATINASSGTLTRLGSQLGRGEHVTVAAKTTYYLNEYSDSTPDSIYVYGSIATTTIRAVCAYL